MTSQTRAAAAAAAMDPQVRAQALRAARGAPPASTTPRVPMGIRYRNPPATTRSTPTEPRPRWAVLATGALLGEVTEPAPRPARSRRRTAAAADTAGRAVSVKPRDVDKPVLSSSPNPTPASTGSTITAVPQQRVLRRFAAHACESCGSRYRFNDLDHPCGPLTPVTVTVTAGPATTAAAQVGVLGSYDAHACEACGHRYGQQVPDHPCGPLIPVTVTIRVRDGGDRS